MGFKPGSLKCVFGALPFELQLPVVPIVTDEDVKKVKIKIEKVKMSKVFLYLVFRVSFFPIPFTGEIIDKLSLCQLKLLTGN